MAGVFLVKLPSVLLNFIFDKVNISLGIALVQ